MNPRLVELALRKQRLQLRAEAQRENMALRLSGIEAALDRLDAVRDNFSWAREKIPLLSVGALAVLAFKPRLTFRLARRAWLGWVLLRRLRGRPLNALLPVAAPLLRQVLKSLKRALAARGQS